MEYYGLDGSWVKSELDKDSLQRRLFESDIIVSDLDATIASSPAEKMAYSSLGNPTYWNNLRYWWWLPTTAVNLLLHGKRAYSISWQRFIQLNPGEVERVAQNYTPESALATVYPRVSEFYSLVPNTTKILVTRNVAPVGQAYGEALKFDDVMSLEFDKEDAMRRILNKYPERRRFIVNGDIDDDRATAEYLKFEKRRGKIYDVTTIHITRSPNQSDPTFDVNMGRDYRGLVLLMTNPTAITLLS